MPTMTELKAALPEALKREAMSVFALRGEKFAPWMREQLQRFIQEHKAAEKATGSEAKGAEHG